MTETEIANLALIKAGGAGDQSSGAGVIVDINGSDVISQICKILLPVYRKKVIADLSAIKCVPREAIRYKDLGAALSSASLPEIGEWQYAFNLPSDCLAPVRQISEAYLLDSTKDMPEYRFGTIANKTATGIIFLTNDLTNADEDSAFIEYAIDIPNPKAWSESLKHCIITLYAAELCPMIGKKAEQRTALLAEYKQLTLPDVKKFISSSYNNFAKTIPDYKGGRN
jgi:hypothetical protein